LKIETKNLSSYGKPERIKELYEAVVEDIDIDCDEVFLAIVDSYSEAMQKLFNKNRIYHGITGIARPEGPEEVSEASEDYEYPAMRSALDLGRNSFCLIVKPLRILESGMSYEQVTMSFAHELSEAVIFKSKQREWAGFYPEQRELFRSFRFSQAERMLRAIQIHVRERLADKYAAERGYARVILSALSPPMAVYSRREPNILLRMKSNYPWYATMEVGWDESISLESAGYKNLAEVWLRVWRKYWNKLPKYYLRFFDYYLKFRGEFLSQGLTAASLLSVFNSRFLETYAE